MTQEDILYKYYLNQTTKARDEAIELLKKRDFTSLHRNYIHWFDKTIKVVPLKSNIVSDVIKELSEIKFADNESEPYLSPCFDENESGIEIISYLYTIVPIEKCEKLAKNHTSSSLWKLKYQPNSKDAENCRKILNKFKTF